MTSSEKIVLTPLKPPSRKKTVIILVIVAVLFVVAGICAIFSTNNDKEYYQETTAVITSIVKRVESERDTTVIPDHGIVEGTQTTTYHDVYVTYSVDGETFSDVKLPNYDISMKEGKTVTITYDSRNPGIPIASAKDSLSLGIAIIVVGVLLCLSTIVYSIILHKENQQETKRIKRLLETGIKIRTTVDSIEKGLYCRFHCMVDGHSYSSPKLNHTEELSVGCMVDIYFDSVGYDVILSSESKHHNYYIDLNSATKATFE